MTDLQGLADALAVETGQSVSGELRERLARAVLGLTCREAERALRRGYLRQRGWTEGRARPRCWRKRSRSSARRAFWSFAGRMCRSRTWAVWSG